jgi:hypothetical protein
MGELVRDRTEAEVGGEDWAVPVALGGGVGEAVGGGVGTWRGGATR